jgi:hypothetical protein
MVVASGAYVLLLTGAVMADGGLLWLWAAFSCWVGFRWIGLYARYRTDHWVVTGTVRTP